MHSLFFRIFILFWVSMALIVGGSIALTIAVSSHEMELPGSERRPELAVRASQVLAQGGLTQLRRWLQANKDAIPQRDFFIVDPNGNDILGRPLTENAIRRVEFLRRPPPMPRGMAPPFGAPWPGRAAPQIVATDGQIFTIVFSPRKPGLFGALSLPGIPVAVLSLALLVSALASGWLARHFSAPIRRIQEGARAVASEQLDVRVSAGFEDRRDELAVLARDFDAMADQLRTTRRARTQLLRDMSHELRSPLARMRMAVGLARQSEADSMRQLDRMEAEIERLDALISQILKLARLHGADMHLQRETFDLGELIDDVAADARFEGTSKGCGVQIRGEPGGTVFGHRELLRSAIENVLRNAIRYSPAGASVEIDCKRCAAAVEIRILDRGIGVPADELKRIFDPFYRVAESRDRDSGGDGIGLAITSQVLKAHGGSACAANRPGGGLEVLLTIPQTPAVQAGQAPAMRLS